MLWVTDLLLVPVATREERHAPGPHRAEPSVGHPDTLRITFSNSEVQNKKVGTEALSHMVRKSKTVRK